jgi:hypothetical protein
MAATRLIRGIQREIWQELVAQTPGDGAVAITTNIRIGAGQLCRVQGLFTCDVPTGSPTWTVVPSRSAAGFLVVTVTNTAAGGNNGTWTLDVRLVQSISQANQGATQGSQGTTGYIMISNGATSGLGGTQTLAQTYAIGSAAADQRMIVTTADGGGITIDCTDAGVMADGTSLEIRQSAAWSLPTVIGRRGNDALAGLLQFDKARNTYLIPEDVQANDELGAIEFYGRVNATPQRGARIVGKTYAVDGNDLEGSIAFYTRSASGEELVATLYTSAGFPRLQIADADGDIVPAANNQGHLGHRLGPYAWQDLAAYTINALANVCLGAGAVGGGANLTVMLPNTATLPAPQADQVYLGSNNFALGTTLAAFAICAEEPAIDPGEGTDPQKLIPIIYNGVSMYLLAALDDGA